MECQRHRFSYVVGIVDNSSTYGLTVILLNTIISDVQSIIEVLKAIIMKLLMNYVVYARANFCSLLSMLLLLEELYYYVVTYHRIVVYGASSDDKLVVAARRWSIFTSTSRTLTSFTIVVPSEYLRTILNKPLWRHGKNSVISRNNTGNTASNFHMLSDLMSAVVWKLDYNDINDSLFNVQFDAFHKNFIWLEG
uniref:Uncharacterized protein n=1 Tax=Glossina pallidipes TaxID=7398 RepID=A0A1B0A5L6_GLOPL